MILVPRAVRVYFAIAPQNLRRSFDGLANEIRHTLAYDPLSGHVFVFLNRRKNQVKLIVWTRGGFTIVHEIRTRHVYFSERCRRWSDERADRRPRIGDVARRNRCLARESKAAMGTADTLALDEDLTIDDIHSRRAHHPLRAIVK